MGPEGDLAVGAGRLEHGGQLHLADRRRGEAERTGRPGEAAAEQVHRADELRDEAVRRMVEELDRRADLLNHALVHHRDPVAGGHRLLLVVGHEDRGDAEAPLQLLQFLPRLHAQLGVEVGQRLVEQQDLRLDRESARDRHALLLAPGKLAGAARLEPGELHQLEHGRHLAPDVVARQPALLQPERHVLRDRHVRPQRVVLEHHAHVAPPRRHRADVAAPDQHLARLVAVEARDEPQQSRLAGTGRAEQREELARRHGKRDVAQHLRAAEAERDVAKLDRHWRHGLSPETSRGERAATMRCENHVPSPISTTAMTPRAAPGPRPAIDCMYR